MKTQGIINKHVDRDGDWSDTPTWIAGSNQKLAEVWNGLSLRASGRNQACWHLDFGLLASYMVREQISVVQISRFVSVTAALANKYKLLLKPWVSNELPCLATFRTLCHDSLGQLSFSSVTPGGPWKLAHGLPQAWPHEPFLFADFTLYPFPVKNHGRSDNSSLSAMSGSDCALSLPIVSFAI